MSGAPCGISITVIALIQRVSSAIVRIDLQSVAEIDTGLLVFIGVKPTDTDENARRLLSRLLNYRVFPDDNSKMNVSLRQIGGGLLLVPQFTLAADTRHGLRPGFSPAAPPELGRRLFALAGRDCAGAALPGGKRPVRRQHAGFAGQRRPGDFLAGGLAKLRGIAFTRRTLQGRLAFHPPGGLFKGCANCPRRAVSAES
jgi:D-tyrosyl-tRNA(Tyr) deacylase